jgi:hypothetical protein
MCTYTEKLVDGKHVYIFTGKCMLTRKPYSVTIPGEELYAYRQGALIQDAMPSVSAEDREFLISGYSPEGWKKAFDTQMGWLKDDKVYCLSCCSDGEIVRASMVRNKQRCAGCHKKIRHTVEC